MSKSEATKTRIETMVELLLSPWIEAFEEFARSIRRSALFVSPFVTAGPLERLATLLDKQRAPEIEILTNLGVDNLVQGSTDPNALALFCRTIPGVTVRHLPGLHAKVYVADDTLAIVTSANLTQGGLQQNYEYGVEIRDPTLVLKIREDLKGYGELGSDVSLLDLEQLAEISEDLHEHQSRVLRSAKGTLREEFQTKRG